jgi:NTE family protein
VVDIAGDAAAPLASPDPNTRVLEVANAYTDPSARPSRSDADHFVVPHETELALLDVADAVQRLVDDRWRPMSRVIGRLARTIERRVVGVALGAGAAFGLAHIGVLRVLDDAGIPIDVVAGSSIGAVIGTGYAAGATGAELEAIAYERSSFARLAASTVDVAFTGDGLMAGRRLLSYLRPFLFGARDFDDCVLPMRAVASDLAHGEAVPIGEGSVELAMRASIAVPPVLSPVLVDGRTLVDGGITNPVPCNVVRDLGADVVIAVDVVPRPDADATTLLTRLSRGLNRVNPLAYLSGRVDSQNVIDTVMNAFQLIEFELGTYQARSADVVVRPELSSHTWIELYRAPELVAGGVAAGRDSLPQVRRVLAERIAAARPVA